MRKIKWIILITVAVLLIPSKLARYKDKHKQKDLGG